MNRSNENSQQKKEDVDQNDDECEAPQGTFAKASDDELKSRKIIKVKRKIGDESSNKPSNPFAALGNSFLINPSANIPFQSTNLNPTIATTSVDNKKLQSDASDEFSKRIKKLNQSFSNWMEKQMTENSYSLWVDAARDYIKYASEIVEKFGPNENKEVKPLESNKLQSIPSIPPTFQFNSKEILNTPQEKSSIPPQEKPSVPSFPSFSMTNNTTATAVNSIPSFKFPSESLLTTNPVPPFKLSNESTGFQFGTTSANNSNIPSIPSFNFGQSAVTSTSTTGGFQFNSSLPTPSFPSFGLSNTGISNSNIPSFNSSILNSNTGVSSSSFPSFTTTTENDDEGEGEGEPILEPEKAIRNKDDNDEILYEANSKILRFDKKATEWKDMGKGTFRITKTIDSGKNRMLMRSLTGKIMFNASFYKGIKFDKIKGGIKFNAINASEIIAKDEKPELQIFIVKVKESEISNLYDKLVECSNLLNK